jgi:electron transfer flavoprotein-quinone oxidoreductase
MTGMGFLYANKESISIGIGCLVSDFQKTGETPYDLLDRFKKHPSIAPLIEGSEVKEYAGHLIPEGGYNAIPQLYGDGWVVVGDAAQLNNFIHREGSNLAMTSGRLAAEAIFQVKSRKDPMTKENLSLYKKMIDDSFVMKDLKKYKDMPGLLHIQSQNFFLTYPQLVSKALQNFVRVDGTPKVEKEKLTLKSFVSARSWTGLFGDAIRFARAWR